MKPTSIVCLAALALGLGAQEPNRKPAYQLDFQSAAPGSVPDDFLVLDGAFSVQAEGTNRFLELPGAPLETFGLLFGPTDKNPAEVRARIFGTRKKRRGPVFGVGLYGAAGVRLLVTPSKNALEIHQGDQLLHSLDFDWKSDLWNHLRFQAVRQGDQWRARGKVWPEGSPEPEAWQIETALERAPSGGRASLWGSPFSETPIRYDDLATGPLP